MRLRSTFSEEEEFKKILSDEKEFTKRELPIIFLQARDLSSRDLVGP